ncbi:MAG: recombinase family protein [Candidatus Paceibacteria bacterium]
MNEKQFVLGNLKDKILVQEYALKNKIKLNEVITESGINNKTIDNYINQLPDNVTIFLENITTLGNSTFHILKRIKILKEKNTTIHIINKDLNLHLGNNILFKVLDALLELEISKVKHRTDTAKDTRDKKNIKLGRKKGQTSKSKYDKHKKRILYLHKQGVPNTKIVEDIKLGTPQSLGKYIKQIKIKTKRKQKRDGTYIHKENDLKNISKNFGTSN